ncbi:hypothetical protein GKQ38_05525 [Candidatus Nanohaloarchaea archaeon]|nr:hypothetical protein GKQ38_05525 [Candidatus Nanohaloarchaea archaeon]
MEEFSVRELADYYWNDERENYDEVEDLAATNLAISGIRSYDLEPDFSDMDNEQALALLVHDAAVDIYELNSELDSEEFFELMASDINYRISQEDELDQELVFGSIEGRPLKDIVEEVSNYYEQNFQEGENVKTERVLENNGFHGRADIIRDVDGETELRDIKTHYTETPVPGPLDGFKVACYALISRDELEVDSFVIEYPLQGTEIEVEPEEWFGEVAEKAREFEEILEEGRENQAGLLESDLGTETDRAPRDFVEGLNLPYEMNKAYARSALPEGIKQ